MATTKQLIAAICRQVDLHNYESISIGDYVGTCYGDFILTSRPNIYQPIDDRTWEFEQTTDETGEPLIDGGKIKIIS